MADFLSEPIEKHILDEEDIWDDDVDIFDEWAYTIMMDQFYTCSFCHCDITDEEYDNGGICSNCANKF